MKTLLVAIFALCPLLSLADHHKEKKAAKKEMTAPFRHVVCFKFKKEATPKQIKKPKPNSLRSRARSKQLLILNGEPTISPENRAKGFTHCFIVTFKDQAGLDVCLPHKRTNSSPNSKPILEDVFVIDYIAGRSLGLPGH